MLDHYSVWDDHGGQNWQVARSLLVLDPQVNKESLKQMAFLRAVMLAMGFDGQCKNAKFCVFVQVSLWGKVGLAQKSSSYPMGHAFMH